MQTPGQPLLVTQCGVTMATKSDPAFYHQPLANRRREDVSQPVISWLFENLVATGCKLVGSDNHSVTFAGNAERARADPCISHSAHDADFWVMLRRQVCIFYLHGVHLCGFLASMVDTADCCGFLLRAGLP